MDQTSRSQGESFTEPAPPLPDVLNKYAPKDKPMDDWVEPPREGENWLTALERAAFANMAETRKANFYLGATLARIADGTYWAELKLEGIRIASMEDYIRYRFDEISVRWAWILMSVATHFPLPIVEQYGVTVLNELIKLKLTAIEFKDLQPIDLIDGAHPFAEADGHVMTLHFRNSHNLDHLKKLVAFARNAALAREGKPPPRKMSEDAEKVRAMVAAAAEQVPGTHWKVGERKKDVVIELSADLKHLSEMLKKLAETI